MRNSLIYYQTTLIGKPQKWTEMLRFHGLEILHLELMVMRRHYMKMQKSSAGTHLVLDDEGKQNTVMGIARIKGGKIYRYDHMRKLADN